jgi:signal transduction histidine kinase
MAVSGTERTQMAGKKRTLLQQYLWVQLAWTPAITAVIAFVRHPNGPFRDSFVLSWFIGSVVASGCFAWVAAIRWLEQRVAARRGQAAAQHSVGWYLALSVTAMPPGLWLAFKLAQPLFGIAFSLRLQDYSFGLTIGALTTGFFFLWQTRADAREAAHLAELRLRESEKATLLAQLRALTAQMNPHLLFNALNTILSMVHNDPDRAEAIILRLSDLYRGVLASTEKTTHTFGEELRICSAYLEVERARFGDRLATVVDAPPETEAVAVPVLVLQPLVENAVIHGISPQREGGTLTVRAHLADGMLVISVEDDGVGLGQSTRSGAKMAIENTRTRLRLCHGERASLELVPCEGGGTRALAKIPVTP